MQTTSNVSQGTGVGAHRLSSFELTGAIKGAIALYQTVTEARERGFKTVHFIGETMPAALLSLQLTHSFKHKALWARDIDEVLEAIYEAATGDEQTALHAMFESQIHAMLKRSFEAFIGGTFGQAVNTKRLSKEQYVSVLTTMHLYVRWTTRLLGSAVANGADTEMRSHLAGHLSGEVNHELIIEADLRALNAFNKNTLERTVAKGPIRAFMFAQQSLVSFERDSLMFLACPLAVEGISGMLENNFIETLQSMTREWVKDTAKGTTFFSSHVGTDGGVDGHLNQTVRFLAKRLVGQREFSEFRAIYEIVSASFLDGINTAVSNLTVFGA
jgi:hypothetical protein